MIADIIRLSALYVIVRVFVEIAMPSSRLIVKYLFWAAIALTIINTVGPVITRVADDIHNVAVTYSQGREVANSILGNGENSSPGVGYLGPWERITGNTEWQVPVKGKVTQGYEEGKHHGIDIGAKEGAAITSTRPGIASKVLSDPIYGLMITIDHGGGYESLYAHCSKVLVTEGTKILKGDKIALVGNTGKSTGNHLHFEIRINGGQTIDPAKYLK